MLLRLVGAGRTLNRAIHEVMARPSGDALRDLVLPLLLALRIEGPHTLLKEDPEIMQSLEEIYQQVTHESEQRGIQRGEQRGEQRGKLDALHSVIISLYTARFGAIPATIQAQVLAVQDLNKLQQLVTVVGLSSLEEMTTRLTQEQPA